MEPGFWAEAWRTGRIGFHEGAPNANLVRFADRLAGRHRILVPLCGKSVDLAYLAAHGHEVVGVELVEDAVRAFFAEQQIAPTVAPRGALTAYSHGAITLLAGDLFAVRPADVGTIDGIYDRAALVALPEHLRQRYVDHLLALSGPWLRALVVSLEYDRARMSGPPFAISEIELARLYDGYHLTKLAEGPEPRPRPDRPPMTERCHWVSDSPY